MAPTPFPTRAHSQAAEAATAFFSRHPGIEAVLVTNSCARGVATPESDLDMAVLVSAEIAPGDRAELEQAWRGFASSNGSILALRALGRFTGLHLDLFDGNFVPEVWDDGGGPDSFELEVGNLVCYSAPVWERGSGFAELRSTWLPYYAEDLRSERQKIVRDACLYDLAFIPAYVSRGLYFQAFDRLYKAFQEFLQALFISRRFYPLAYNKWVREQVAVQLGLPELYGQLPAVLQVSRLESDELVNKAERLTRLVESWVGS